MFLSLALSFAAYMRQTFSAVPLISSQFELREKYIYIYIGFLWRVQSSTLQHAQTLNIEQQKTLVMFCFKVRLKSKKLKSLLCSHGWVFYFFLFQFSRFNFQVKMKLLTKVWNLHWTNIFLFRFLNQQTGSTRR